MAAFCYICQRIWKTTSMSKCSITLSSFLLLHFCSFVALFVFFSGMKDFVVRGGCVGLGWVIASRRIQWDAKYYFPPAWDARFWEESPYMPAGGPRDSDTLALTHLPMDKMAASLQTIFLDAFLWMNNFLFWLNFHWRLFPSAQLTINQHWFR